MGVEIVNLGFTPKGRETIRRKKDAGSVPSDPLQPAPPVSRSVGLWIFNPEPHTTLAKLESAYLGALEAVDQVEGRRAEAKASGNFTDDGVRADVLAFAASDLAPKLRRHQQTVDQAQQELKERREKLVLPAPDKTDAAGQMRRLWRLDKLRALSDQERNSYIAKNLDKLHPELVQAVLEMPEYSGLLDADLDQIRERAFRASHGATLDELNELDRGIALADRAVRMAREEVAIEAGVDLAKFDTTAAPFERKVGPWLKNTPDGVRVVRWNGAKTGGTLAVPTADELEGGVFYDDFAEYEAAHGGVAA